MKVVSIALHEAAAGGGTGQYAGYGLLLHPAVAISLVGLVLAAPLQLFLINNTLASLPVSYAVPVYQALLTLLTTAAGGIFFREFAKTTMMTNLLYGAGAATSLAGLGVLGSAQQADPQAQGGLEGSPSPHDAPACAPLMKGDERAPSHRRIPSV